MSYIQNSKFRRSYANLGYFLQARIVPETVNLPKLDGKYIFYTKQLISSYVKSNYILLVLRVRGPMRQLGARGQELVLRVELRRFAVLVNTDDFDFFAKKQKIKSH